MTATSSPKKPLKTAQSRDNSPDFINESHLAPKKPARAATKRKTTTARGKPRQPQRRKNSEKLAATKGERKVKGGKDEDIKRN